MRASKSSQLKPMQVYKIKLYFFSSKFSIIAKNFKSYFDRVDSEAYYIRTLNPDLNCQKKHRIKTILTFQLLDIHFFVHFSKVQLLLFIEKSSGKEVKFEINQNSVLILQNPQR